MEACLRLVILRRDGSTARCGSPAVSDAQWADSVDHIAPVSRGGEPWDPRNLRASSRGFNMLACGKLPAPDTPVGELLPGPSAVGLRHGAFVPPPG